MITLVIFSLNLVIRGDLEHGIGNSFILVKKHTCLIRMNRFVKLLFLCGLLFSGSREISGNENPNENSLEISENVAKNVTKQRNPTQFADSDLRLPRNVLPRHYTVRLLPFIFEGNFTTDGYVEILVECIENTNTITLHMADIILQRSTVQVTHVSTHTPVAIDSLEEDTIKEFLIISLSENMIKGQQYTISMTFLSHLNDQLRGFYRSSYIENGQKIYIAASQMQPTDARRAFPCFDEPNMKANFTISLGRQETQLSTSNMPLKETTPIEGLLGYVWDHFETSLPMSTYLVGLLVADFVYLESSAEFSSTRFRIWTRPDAILQAEYASKIGPQILEFYEDYFQIPFPLPKQDMIALNDLSFGGMENWGMITYRESALLYDPLKSSESNKQRVCNVVAHELAHQWFGDLVTMDWWSDLWLNEGFATYMEYIAADYAEPTFEILQQMIVDEIQYVFATDALETSHPISVVVNNPNEINELFDSISYSKGGSLLRMLNKFLGDDTFRRGLTTYLNSRIYGNAVQDDLWSSLTQQAILDNVSLPIDVKSIMDTWTLKMGYPVVNVIRNYETGSATISQQRFLLRPTSNSSDPTIYQWWIPLTYTWDFHDQPQSIWLSDQQLSIETDPLGAEPNQWIICNVNETGYFRVNYDFDNWNLIGQQLIANRHDISVINRAQLMDDSLNIARAGLLPYGYALDLTRYLNEEREYLPWKSALNALSYLDLMLERLSGYGYFKHYMTNLILPLYNDVQFNDTSMDSHLLIYTRISALRWACKLDVRDCVDNSVRVYQAWMEDSTNPSIVSANQKETIACTAIRHGGESQWDFAYEKYLETNVAAEKNTLLYALSCSKEAWILSRMLEWSLNSSSGIRRQDASSVFRNVASNPMGRYLAFDFIRGRWSEMVAYFPTLYDLARIVDTVAEGFNTPLEVEELKLFQAEHDGEFGTAARAIVQAIERAEANVKWMELHYDEIVTWLQQHQ